jgi:hypothetical protein
VATLRGDTGAIEREPRTATADTRTAYLQDLTPDDANVYGVGYGMTTDATGFLKDVGGGSLVVDDDADNQDRALFRVDSEQILVGDDDVRLLFLYTPRAIAADMGTFSRASTASYVADTSVTELHYTPGAGHLPEYFSRASTATYNTSS